MGYPTKDVREDFVKREFYLLVTIESGAIVLYPRNSVYLLVPQAIREELRRVYGIDLQNRKKDYEIECTIARVGDEVKLVYSFRKRGSTP